MSPGPLQILIICLVIALVIGPSRITRMARSLGRGAYDFVDELGRSKEDKDEHRRAELESEESSRKRGEDREA